MSEQVPLTRLYLLRGMYLLNFAFLGFGIWPELIGLHREWEPLSAVAFCFWAALAALSGLGLRYPLAMLPLLLLQLLYKLVWVVAFWLPLQFAGPVGDMRVGGRDLSVMFIGGVVADLIVIPWSYVLARFVRARGNRWKHEDTQTQHSPHPSSGLEATRTAAR